MFKNVKEKLATIHTFKSSSEAAIKRSERAAVQNSTNKTRIAGDGNFESFLAKAVARYFKDAAGLADPWLSNSVNVKFSVTADFVANDDPVVISADAGAKVAKSIRDLEYFQEQKTWTLELMKRAKLQQGVSSIVKPGIQTRVRNAIKDLIPGIPDMSKEDRYATIKDIMEPKCYQLTSESSKLQTSNDYGLSEIKLNVEGGGE